MAASRSVRPIGVLVLATVGLVLAAVAARAEEAVVQAQRPPHYVGDPVLIRVSTRGFEEDPQPECTHEGDATGLELNLVNATPSVSSMVRIIQGRRTEERTVTWNFDFYAVAAEEGNFTVGPFRVRQGGRTALTGTVRIAPRHVPADPQMRVALRMPKEPVYPGQRVAIEIEWAYAGDVNAIDDLTIRSPLFDGFHFEDEPAKRGDSLLPLTTTKGVLRVKAALDRRHVAGGDGVVLTARRTLIPDRSGKFDLGPITASMNKVVRWRRTIFGDREPAEVARVRAEGAPLRLVVKDLPSEGRPGSFAGAIGRGFTLEAAADRTVVRVGDPITLTLTLRGDGNLENAGLPPLSADGGLDPEAFGLPEGEVPGTLEEGRKTFHVTVRVRAEGSSEIPAIAYSFFDPEAAAYRTTHSSPIALQVRETTVISARDVVSATPEEPRPEGSAPPPMRPSARPRFDVTGADLSIRTNPDEVLASEADRFGGAAFRIAPYALGVLLLLFALWGRRRSHIDPEVLRRRALLATQRARLGEAGALGAAEGCRHVAAALRALGPELDPARKTEFESAAAACDAAAYAPTASTDKAMDPKLLEQARALVDRAARELV